MKPYQMSIPTGLTKSGVDVLATIDKACGSGSGGGNCLPVPCRVCVEDSVDITFGGVLAGIGVITLPVISSGGDNPYYTAETPFMGVETACGTLEILFQIDVAGTGYLIQVKLNGTVIFRRAGNPSICGEYVGGMPDSFTYPLDEDGDGTGAEGTFGPNFTVSGNEDGCNGAASIVVTNSGSGDGSGSTNPYDFALDTLLTKGGKRVLAAINCAGSGSGNSLYWYGYDTGLRKNGKRVLAGYNPCCGSGPTILGPPVIINGASCGFTCEFPRIMYLELTPNPRPGVPCTGAFDVTMTVPIYFVPGTTDETWESEIFVLSNGAEFKIGLYHYYDRCDFSMTGILLPGGICRFTDAIPLFGDPDTPFYWGDGCPTAYVGKTYQTDYVCISYPEVCRYDVRLRF